MRGNTHVRFGGAGRENRSVDKADTASRPDPYDLKTIDNWALVPGRGKRAFVPPDDPRHPQKSARAA